MRQDSTSAILKHRLRLASLATRSSQKSSRSVYLKKASMRNPSSSRRFQKAQDVSATCRQWPIQKKCSTKRSKCMRASEKNLELFNNTAKHAQLAAERVLFSNLRNYLVLSIPIFWSSK